MITGDTVAAQPLEQAHIEALAAALLASNAVSILVRGRARARGDLETAALAYTAACQAQEQATVRDRLAWDAADAAADAMVAAGLPDPRKQGEP